MSPVTPIASPWPGRWQRFKQAVVRDFHGYSAWLVSITWWRFLLLSLLLMVLVGIAQSVPPFSWTYTRLVPTGGERVVKIERPQAPVPPAPPAPPPAPSPSATPAPPAAPAPTGTASGPAQDLDLRIRIGKDGVHITRAPAAPASAASAASGIPAAGAPAPAAPAGDVTDRVLREVGEAVEQVVREAERERAADAAAEAAEAAKPRRHATITIGGDDEDVELHETHVGESLPPLALMWIIASAIIKITYKRQIAAEAQAAQAVQTAGAEQLKRQVLEARMAAMQAQVEPHFLFNTLASIDHLIEVDPPRASQMQKHLIALLRASMPTLREASDGGVRDLGREVAVVRPYLELLKMRMEERLDTALQLPDGLLSAEFPPMMLQTLVENAVKHGLEPKPEGGRLEVRAEIVHGQLAITVADTGLGFGRAATAGTGVGLANIRERLQLLYGTQASLTIAENPGGGTRVTIALPYRPLASAKPATAASATAPTSGPANPSPSAA